jgi:putative ABC transport system permease protein
MARNPEWFRALAAQPEVGFIVPTTRQIAATVTLRPVGETKAAARAEVDLIPTAQGDPLLVENGAPVPGHDEVVLSARAAQALNVQAGDKISATATRSWERNPSGPAPNCASPPHCRCVRQV